MKLSKREITLFAVLGIVLGSIVYYKYIIVPQTAIAASVSKDRNQKRNELERFKTDIASKHKLKVELIKLQKKLNNDSEDYFLTLDQEEIILLLNDFAKETNVKVEAITSEEPREEILGEDEDGDESNESSDSKQVKEKNKKEEDDRDKKDKEKTEKTEQSKATVEGETEEDEEDNLDVYTVNLEYESSYASLLDLLKLITNHDKRIMIKDININKEETENQSIKGNITLDFYVIGKMLGEEHALYAWGANPLNALHDPFAQFSGYYVVKQQEDSNSQEEISSSTEEASLSENSSSENTDNSSKSDNLSDTSNTPSGLNQVLSSNISNSNVNNKPLGPQNIIVPSRPSKPQTNIKPVIPNKPQTPSKPTGSENTGSTGENNQGVDDNKQNIKIKDVFTFEDKNTLSFGPEIKDEYITGELSLKYDTEFQRDCLNIEYNFLENRKSNLAKLSFKNGLEIADQPKYISVSVKSIEKSNCGLGVIVKDYKGKQHKLVLTKNLDSDDWKTLVVELPSHIKNPVIESLYLESISDNEKLTGNIGMCDLKLTYINK